MKIGENELGPLQAAKVRLSFAAIWHAGAGGQPTPGAAGLSGPPLPEYPPPTSLTTDMPDVVALNGIVMQTGSILTRLIPQAEYDEMFRTYRKRCGADMAQEIEPTRAQVSCYLALVRERGTVAVDFAVWKCNADRNEKLRAMEGLRFTLDGKIVSLVTYGPGTLQEWILCYKVFRACAIMCGHISPEMLDRYQEEATALANDYPAYFWPLLYQTEVRARSEHLGRVARRLREEKEKADKEGRAHHYSAEHPWEAPWHDLVTVEDKFWEEQFENKNR